MREGAVNPPALAGGEVKSSKNRLEQLDEFTVETVEETLRELIDEKDLGGGDVFHPIRIAVSGESSGPSVTHMIWAIGKSEVVSRIEDAIEHLEK